MKQLIIILCMFMAVAASAQNEKFMGAMQSRMEGYKTAKTPQDFLDISNAHAQVLHGYMLAQTNPAALDPIADKAEQLINKADALEQNNSEITCVKSMIAQLRMMVNPMQRFQQYGTLMNEYLEKAKQQDPANPRPYALQSQSLFYTPAQFGGGCATAKPIAEQGMKLEEAFKPKTELHPKWGKQQFEMVLNGCKQ